jgi:hypothetical protein
MLRPPTTRDWLDDHTEVEERTLLGQPSATLPAPGRCDTRPLEHFATKLHSDIEQWLSLTLDVVEDLGAEMRRLEREHDEAVAQLNFVTRVNNALALAHEAAPPAVDAEPPYILLDRPKRRGALRPLPRADRAAKGRGDSALDRQPTRIRMRPTG